MRGSPTRCCRFLSGHFDAAARSQPGHWEGDLIVGKNQRSAIGTLVERQTRRIRLMHLPSRDADALRIAITTTMSGLPTTLIRSITWDQGIEMQGTPTSPQTSAWRSTSATPAHLLTMAATRMFRCDSTFQKAPA